MRSILQPARSGRAIPPRGVWWRQPPRRTLWANRLTRHEGLPTMVRRSTARKIDPHMGALRAPGFSPKLLYTADPATPERGRMRVGKR